MNIINIVTQGQANTQTDHGSVTSGTENFDVSISSNYESYGKVTVGGDFTIAFTNWPASGKYGQYELQLINGAAHILTWPTISWLKGDGTSSTTFSTMGVTLYASGTNTVIVWSTDGGSTLRGRAA